MKEQPWLCQGLLSVKMISSMRYKETQGWPRKTCQSQQRILRRHSKGTNAGTRKCLKA